MAGIIAEKSAAEAPAAEERTADVWDRLRRVTDPELDEPVTELGFVTAVDVDAEDGVHIGFRLPTYWCAANFAFLMADDMRREVDALGWPRRVTVALIDHMYAETINRGIADGRSFRQAFAEEATEDLDEVRRIFAVKAFQRRQEDLLRHLIDAGHALEGLAGLTLDGLVALELDGAGDRLRARYLEKRGVAGRTEGGCLSFVTDRGEPVPATAMTGHLRELRRVRVNTEFNGALCRGLLAARYDDPAAGGEPKPAGEPTLADFIRDAARGHP